MKIWVNDGLLAAEGALVSVFDHGLTVGDGIFETVKAVHGRPFALTRHLDRLTRSARGLGLPEPDHDRIRRACYGGPGRQPHGAGPAADHLHRRTLPLSSTRGTEAPTLVVAAGGMTRRPDTTAAVTVPWTRNERGAVAGLKTTSYAENVVALARAGEQGASEALLANTVGRLCEGTGTNVFVVVDGELHTPPLASGCLAGITRALVAEWSGARETDLPLDVLERADEIFLTSSTRDVQAVHRIDDRQLPAAPGPVTSKVMRVFEERAGADLDP